MPDRWNADRPGEPGRGSAVRPRNLARDGAVVLLALFAVWIFYRAVVDLPGMREREIEKWSDRLNATASLKDAAIERWVAELKVDTEVVAAFPSVRAEASGRRGDAHIGEILEDMRRRHGDEAVRLVTRGGDPIDGRSPDVTIAAALETAPPETEVTFVIHEAKGWVVVLAPVPESSAFAAIRVDPAAWLHPLLAHDSFRTETSESFLSRRRGTGVEALTPLRLTTATGRGTLSATLGEAAHAALAGIEKVGPFIDHRGRETLAATSRIEGTDWGLVVKIDKTEALADYRKGVSVRLLASTASLLALAILATIVVRSERTRARRKLRRVRDRFQAVLEQAGDAILFVSFDDGRILSVNPAAEELYGRSAVELETMSATELRAPGARLHSARDIDRARLHGQHTFETVHVAADGTEIPVEINARYLEIDGEALFLSVVRDVRQRKASEERIQRLVRFLGTTSAVNRLLLRQPERRNLFDEVCRIAVDTGGFAAAWVGVPRPDGSVSVVSAAGSAPDYLEGIAVRWDDTPEGQGPTGRAVRTAREVVLQDIDADPSYAVWRDTARRHGFRSSIAIPLVVRGTVDAVLNIYSDDVESFRDDTLALALEMAADVAFAIEVGLRTRELEAARRQLNEAEEIAHIGTGIRWLDSMEMECSAEFRNLFGISSDAEATPELLLSRVHPDDRERVAALLAADHAENDLRLVRPDGTMVWVEGRMRCLTIDGRPCRSVTVLDITGRKRAEAKLRAFVEATPIGTINGHVDGRVLSANDEYLRIIGRTREELEAGLVRWDDITPPEWADADASGVAEALEHGACTPYRKEYVRPDGSRVPVIVGFSILPDSGGESIAFILDLTDQVRAEESLRRLNAELEERVAERTAALESANRELRKAIEEVQDLYENAPVAYHSLDAEGIYVRVNDTELRWLGYTRDEMIGRHASEFTTLDLDELDDRVRQNIRDGSLHAEIEMKRRDGTLLPVLVTSVPLLDDGGNFVMTRSSMIDDTERRRLMNELSARNAALEAANRELEAFSYSVSHDLRAPLRAIDGFARILSEDFATTLDGEAKRIIGVIRGGATRMGILIDDLLRLSRAGRVALELHACDMSAIARKAVEQEAEKGAVEVTITELPTAKCDHNLMLQVWTNLVANAVKFTRGRESRRVRISAESSAAEHIFRIRDNGVGFDVRYAGKLFQVFQRLHGEKEFEGTGIGLAIVRRVVERHGGRVGASSVPGEGAEFWFSLPR
jgi:PAS domain S-box-containing protein